MACELWLVRHGQAAFDSDHYDQLTDLGWRQARWVGAHLAESGVTFDRVAAGTLRRQQETAFAIAEALGSAVETVPGLEEYDADGLLAAHGDEPIPRGLNRAEHFRRLRTALMEWSAGGVEGAPESWAEFRGRVTGVVAELTAKGEGAVVASSSGGAIALVIAEALGLAPERMIALNLQARNTGITRLIYTGRGGAYLNMFNAIPHLERPDRVMAQTYS